MEWQFWTQLGAIATGFGAVLIGVWNLRGWAEAQFDSVRENAHKILEKHEEKDERRHHEGLAKITELELETTKRLTALEVHVARLNRGGKRSGPDYVAGP